jgi:hypothetical protein
MSTNEDEYKLKSGELLIGNTYKFKLRGDEIIGTLEERRAIPSDFTSTFLVFNNDKNGNRVFLTINKSKGIFEEVESRQEKDESMNGVELPSIRKNKTDYSYFSGFSSKYPFLRKGGRKSRSKRRSKRKRRTRSSRLSFF